MIDICLCVFPFVGVPVCLDCLSVACICVFLNVCVCVVCNGRVWVSARDATVLNTILNRMVCHPWFNTHFWIASFLQILQLNVARCTSFRAFLSEFALCVICLCVYLTAWDENGLLCRWGNPSPLPTSKYPITVGMQMTRWSRIFFRHLNCEHGKCKTTIWGSTTFLQICGVGTFWFMRWIQWWGNENSEQKSFCPQALLHPCRLREWKHFQCEHAPPPPPPSNIAAWKQDSRAGNTNTVSEKTALWLMLSTSLSYQFRKTHTQKKTQCSGDVHCKRFAALLCG